MDRSGRAIRALVLEGEGKPALAAVRSLGRAGFEVDVVASGSHAISLASRYCHEGFVEPSMRDADAWRAFLIERVKAGRYDALLLTGQSSADLVGEHRALFEPHVRILLPAAESFRIAADKALTVRLAEQMGVPVPRTLFPAGPDDVSRMAATLAYPVVVKGPSGSGSARVRFASSPAQLAEQFAELARLGEADGDSPPMVQELVRGEGVGYSGLYRDGRPLAEFMWRRLLEYPASGGPMAGGESIQDETVRALGRRICEALRWTGPVMIEFKRDQSDGSPRLMEINPRFWGSLELAVRCGVDFPRLYVETCLGRPFDPVLRYDVGRRLSILSYRILLGQVTGQGRLALLGELARPGRFDIDWDDLQPTLWDLRATWWEVRKLRSAGGVAR